MRAFTLAAVAASVIAGCGGNDPLDIPRDSFTYVGSFLNASTVAMSVEVDGSVVLPNVPASVIGAFYADQLPAGTHQIRVRPVGATTGGITFTTTTTAGAKRNLVSYMSNAQVTARALEDTGSIVPEGKSKVRVINLAPNSDIDIWRTQPDFQQGIRFQFPFPFNPDPGPYVQSDAGNWTVWITPTSNANNKLHELGPINIGSGGKRTIVVVDSSGVLRLRVLID